MEEWDRQRGPEDDSINGGDLVEFIGHLRNAVPDDEPDDEPHAMKCGCEACLSAVESWLSAKGMIGVLNG